MSTAARSVAGEAVADRELRRVLGFTRRMDPTPPSECGGQQLLNGKSCAARRRRGDGRLRRSGWRETPGRPNPVRRGPNIFHGQELSGCFADPRPGPFWSELTERPRRRVARSLRRVPAAQPTRQGACRADGRGQVPRGDLHRVRANLQRPAAWLERDSSAGRLTPFRETTQRDANGSPGGFEERPKQGLRQGHRPGALASPPGGSFPPGAREFRGGRSRGHLPSGR